jgi:hypothetical protein
MGREFEPAKPRTVSQPALSLDPEECNRDELSQLEGLLLDAGTA